MTRKESEIGCSAIDGLILLVDHVEPIVLNEHVGCLGQSRCLCPCAQDLPSAFPAALASDPVSAYGGVIAVNRTFDLATAESLGELFVEAIAAPGFEPEVTDFMASHKANCRLVQIPDPISEKWEMRSVAGGVLLQSIDRGDPDDVRWQVVTRRDATEKEFATRIEKILGIPKENYRDIYGMSEMNGLALSCEKRYKHLTDWIYPQVLNENLEPIGFGKWGRFAFLDPAGYSYPGFIITGDRVKLHEKCPKCHKTGVVLESEITRMKGTETRGCGNLMRKLLLEELR